MHDRLKEQARTIHDTIRVIRNRTLRDFTRHAKSDEKDLTIAQLNTLMVIRDMGEMTIKELADAMQVSAPSASTMADRLVDLGCVNREHSRVDRREVHVRISAEGQRIIDRLENHVLQSIVQILEAVGPDWAERWCEVYAKVREAISEGTKSGLTPVREQSSYHE